MKANIRYMIRRDLREVLEIEDSSFEFTWSEQDFLSALKQRNCIGMVAEYKHQIVGYVIYELHKTVVDVLNFAVHPDFRREYIGTQLASRLKDKLIQQRRSGLKLLVRETNLPALMFFCKMGFRAGEVVRNYFEHVGEDAYVMTYRLDRSDSEYAPGLEPKNRISNFIDQTDV